MAETGAIGPPEIDPDLIAGIVSASELGVALIDLRSLRVTAISRPAAAALQADPREIIDHVVSDWVDDVSSGGLPMLATGRLDGFEAGRQVRRRGGDTIESYVWAHALGTVRPATHAVVLAEPASGAAPSQMSLSLAEVPGDIRVLGSVDDEWRVDRVSLEVQTLLGYPPTDVSGAPVLPAVHPNDLSDLLAAVAHLRDSGRSVAVRLRLRTSADSWLLCRARLAGLGPSARFAFSLRPSLAPETAADREDGIRRQLDRIAHEVRVAARTMSPESAPSLQQMPTLASLTSREWDVVARLVNGARVPTIAKDLGLSASTVRNHLSAIYAKLGVGSQAELLERLQAPSGSPV